MKKALLKTQHTVEKIGGTSMAQYVAVRDNIILASNLDGDVYNRIFVVSAYSGITDQLLEHKKTGKPGIYELFANSHTQDSWLEALDSLQMELFAINASFFNDASPFDRNSMLRQANDFIEARLDDTKKCLLDLANLCQFGHFSMDEHLQTVREMLASIGEAHSAWNMSRLLQRDGVNAVYVDLTGWKSDSSVPMDKRIRQAFKNIDVSSQLPICTGYTHAEGGLVAQFDRGYTEMTFSRIAVMTKAQEAIIHKEYHLSSADPQIVGVDQAVPIGRTNYDVADQLANLGMEAIHPRAAAGLRLSNIPLRVKNTFEPEHKGTLISCDYVSEKPQVEIVTGCKGVYALELFDQNILGALPRYDRILLETIESFDAPLVSKDITANSITHYLSVNLNCIKRIEEILIAEFPRADITIRKVALVSAIGSDMKVPGILAPSVSSLAAQNINVLALHQSMRQIDIQFVVEEKDYEQTIRCLHECLVTRYRPDQLVSIVS